MYKIVDSAEFINDPKKILEYLVKRSVKDTSYLNFVKTQKIGYLATNMCTKDGFDFAVSHFLGSSKISGCDIIAANKNLGTDVGNIIAIGLIEGDDVICQSIESNEIFLWMIENDDGKKIKMADSFGEFISLIKEQ